MTSHRILAAAAVLAVAAAPAALAKKGGEAGAHGPKAGKLDRGKGHTKAKNVVLKGVVVSSDETTVTVTVQKANKAGRSLVGTAAQFVVTRLVVADTNADGAVNALDLVAGDTVLVQARIGADSGAPFTARKVIDLTNPPAEDEQEIEGEGAPAPGAS